MKSIIMLILFSITIFANNKLEQKIKLCNNGDNKACNSIGLDYEFGKGGVKKDYAKALKYHKKNCDNGNSSGCHSVGILYRYGKGVNQNYIKAREYFEEACKKNSNACNELAIMYYKNKDKIKSYQYFLKAAKLGNLTAQDNLDILCKKSPWVCK
jgi:TPR repeat protein